MTWPHRRSGPSAGLCDSVLSPDDEAAVADFGICQACLNEITADETDWDHPAAVWEE